MSADLTNPAFTDEGAAMEALEASRWPDGPHCPHCGSTNVHRMAGKTQAGMFLCNDCRDKFTARVGTVLERSHIPVHKWLLAIHLMNSSKKGVSSHQLHRSLGITYKSAWFMAHRIREAMRDGSFSPLGGSGKIVEADETYFGNVEASKVRTETTSGRPFIKKGKAANKRAIVALVERGGNVRTFHVPTADKASVSKIVTENIAKESRLHTDESRLYLGADAHFEAHKTVKHTAKEYARRDVVVSEDGETFTTENVHTNSAEGYFSIFKRGMRGVYQHCGEKHLHRYLAEFDFRYNHRTALGFSDTERAAKALKGIEGKRLTYRRPDSTDVPF